jgi:hypothetical protein
VVASGTIPEKRKPGAKNEALKPPIKFDLAMLEL